MVNSKEVLNLRKGCCRQGQELAGLISPFQRAVALEQTSPPDPFPVAGIAQCHDCHECWGFALVATRGELRAYQCSRFPSDALPKLVTAYTQHQKPKWPVWIPPGYDQMPLQAAHTLRELENRLWDRASPPSLILVTKALVNGRILATNCPGPDIAAWLAQLPL